MFDLHLTAEMIKAGLTLLILMAAIYSFISERISPDVTALLAMLALLLTGILTPGEAFSGFSHPATVSVAAVLVLSAAIEHTGVLTLIARRLLAPLGRSELLLTFVIMVSIGAISAFINNTAAVAIFIPVVLEVCRRTDASPGRVLMPMSHAATLGGMCTLIGTSTNLVAHEFALRQGLPGFSMFELSKVGLPMVVVGYGYMLLVGRRFLPRNDQGQGDPFEHNKRYLAELIVEPGSLWIGRELSPQTLHRDFDLDLVGLMRRGQLIDLDQPGSIYSTGDSLRVSGPLNGILALARQDGLQLHRPERRKLDASLSVIAGTTPVLGVPPAAGHRELKELALAEIVILTTSGLIGETLKSIRFAEKYDAVVLALRRRGLLHERPSTTPLHAGDVLVVEGETESLQQLAETPGFVVIGQPQRPLNRPGGLVLTLLTLLAVVLVVSFGWLPIVTAATAGCAVLMLTGSLRPREAYQAIDLSLVFLLAGSLALGVALEKTGITAWLAKWLAGMTGMTGPYLVLAGFFIVSVIISELMSNSGTVALLGPLAISAAQQMGINPTSLLVAVTFGSSAAFAMPVGYQTSLMVYGPGGYRMRDFVRMGIVLDLLLAALSLLLIPRFWPLQVP
ncbi:MAG TPA: SLC13 family permease [Blastocatellia bacterium]|nr:SLC13 family permease [Blastocatellia bacterium]